ncbi:MAG: putative metal-binding motif-containing protein [Candidatus Kerfeldbacteria bacterium]
MNAILNFFVVCGQIIAGIWTKGGWKGKAIVIGAPTSLVLLVVLAMVLLSDGNKAAPVVADPSVINPEQTVVGWKQLRDARVYGGTIDLVDGVLSLEREANGDMTVIVHNTDEQPGFVSDRYDSGDGRTYLEVHDSRCEGGKTFRTADFDLEGPVQRVTVDHKKCRAYLYDSPRWYQATRVGSDLRVWIPFVESDPGIDNDGDGYCEGATILFFNGMASGTGCTDNSKPGDCNDISPWVRPGRREDMTNGVDDDCDGKIDEYEEADSEDEMSDDDSSSAVDGTAESAAAPAPGDDDDSAAEDEIPIEDRMNIRLVGVLSHECPLEIISGSESANVATLPYGFYVDGTDGGATTITACKERWVVEHRVGTYHVEFTGRFANFDDALEVYAGAGPGSG